MKVVIQKVKNASVKVNNKIVGEIEKGLLLFTGFETNDTCEHCKYAAKKITNLRVFEDENKKMNLSVKEVKGKLLAVSQFTLAGSIKKGRRPSFDNAMEPEKAKQLFQTFVELLKQQELDVQTGIFQEYMEVSLTNDGPVTFILEK
jgi:D-tyrosyl-tRNA(Tyr) deacylase